MSLDKAIYYGKGKRKPYRDSRRFDWSCRNHKSCPYCYDTRTKKQREQDRLKLKEIKEYKESKDQ